MHNNHSAYYVARRILPIAVAFLAIGCAGPAICDGDSIEQDIEKMAADLNKRLPQQVDAATRLERIEAGPGKAYSYVYTLGANLTDSQKQQVRETVTHNALSTPDMQPMLRAGVTVWYKYFDATGNKVLEFPVRGEVASEKDNAHDAAFRIGFVIGAFGGGLIAGVLCGSLPLFIGIRRGRPKLAIAAMVSCAAAGLALGILLAVPTTLVFTTVILAIPRVVPKGLALPTEFLE
jgi:hypothetical protein